MNYFNEKSYEDGKQTYDKKAMGENTTCSSGMNMGMDMGMNNLKIN